MTQEINLHGGPWHGRVIVIPNDVDHFHLEGPDFDQMQTIAASDGVEAMVVPLKEGTYSRVGTSKTDFEWDGWLQ